MPSVVKALAFKLASSSKPGGWARGEREEREGYGEPRDVTSLSLSQT